MDYRERRREQARHKRLGTFILVISAFCGMLSGAVIGAFIPIPIPFAPLIIGVIIAGGIYGGLKQGLGYDRRKASTQYLKGQSADDETLPSHLIPEAPVFADDAEDSTGSPDVEQRTVSTAADNRSVVVCPHCGMKVVPKSDGRCPSCQSSIPER